MENEFAYNARYPLHPFINRCRTAYVRDRRSTAVLWRSHGRLLICFARGFDARALSRIATDATIRICPNARRERSPARPDAKSSPRRPARPDYIIVLWGVFRRLLTKIFECSDGTFRNVVNATSNFLTQPHY